MVNLADLLFDGDLDEAGEAVHVADSVTDVLQLRSKADTIAAAVRGSGVEPGRAVAVMLPNGVDLVAALFGVWRAGAVYVPLNPRLTDTELATEDEKGMTDEFKKKT